MKNEDRELTTIHVGDIDTKSPTPASPEPKQDIPNDSSVISKNDENNTLNKLITPESSLKSREKSNFAAPFTKSKTTIWKMAKTLQRRMATKLNLRREKSKLISISTEPKSLRTSRASLKSDLILRREKSGIKRITFLKNRFKTGVDSVETVAADISLPAATSVPPNNTENFRTTEIVSEVDSHSNSTKTDKLGSPAGSNISLRSGEIRPNSAKSFANTKSTVSNEKEDSEAGVQKVFQRISLHSDISMLHRHSSG